VKWFRNRKGSKGAGTKTGSKGTNGKSLITDRVGVEVKEKE
jgi:hypothetical protein